jgi:hypothetical protein
MILLVIQQSEYRPGTPSRRRTAERMPRRAWLDLLHVAMWLGGTVIIAIPVMSALAVILDQLSLGLRLVFYVMPALLSGLLVLGVLQIIAIYRHWFGPR